MQFNYLYCFYSALYLRWLHMVKYLILINFIKTPVNILAIVASDRSPW